MKRYALLILLLCSTFMYAQNASSIDGKLIDKEYNNEPLAFGTVSIKGTTIETSSDIDGSYNFTGIKPGEYVLIYSFLGYKTQEKVVIVSPNKSTEVNVFMSPRTSPLNNAMSSVEKNHEGEANLTSS